MKAIKEGGANFQITLDRVSCFALAVNEENAAFGRVVTAPTNGAAEVIPAVLQYYIAFCSADSYQDDEDKITRFLLTAAEIVIIFKKGATISAAMGKVSLDKVIATMWNTALDMNSKYKETADGGLAVQLPLSLSEY